MRAPKNAQHGVVLLWVAATLAIIAALAYAMSHEGAMTAQNAETQRDTDIARYLAEAGLSLAKWRNEQAGCKNYNDVATTPIAGIGTYAAVVSKGSSKTLNIVATGISAGGARVQLTRSSVVVHDLGNDVNTTLQSGGTSGDIWISSASPTTPMTGTPYLELNQGSSNALLKFDAPKPNIPTDAVILQADLKLTKYQDNSSLGGKVISVHRMLRDWDSGAATWNNATAGTAWGSSGADYDAGNIAAITVTTNFLYSWDITTLVDGWYAKGLPNYGLLVKPDGPLVGARFYSFEYGFIPTLRPQVAISFAPPC
ncbi:Tfp pilus assembly protein PilX [Actimicrobium sp. GrIS 1.19]|uniref:DNRLRE domain-containing protein n=1 Tax=Actimicrobium sp. GrIS 1.19 TaxID=3071708 RepID=UPI002E009749|nr:Tfp pilus assembly protein PilX [Actimicrobium sp. GrIS 1.19]